MQTIFTPDQVRTIAAAAESAARSVEWRLRLPHGEWEDLRQDLLTDLLRRLPSYDPGGGTLEAFAHVVFAHRAVRIATRIGTERRKRGPLLSLDLPLDDVPRPLCKRIAENEGLWSPTETSTATAERRCDVANVLAFLAEGDRELCAGLATNSATALVRAGFGSRSHIYRRIADLRCVLTVHGLGPAWDDLVAA